MGVPERIVGERFADVRGVLQCVNGCDLAAVRRFYVLHHPDTAVVRGWNGHRAEQKWFVCVRGSFTLALVAVDDFEQPSRDLVPQVYRLSAETSEAVHVPGGYANAFKALEPDSVMLVFSDKTLAEAAQDSWRFPADWWMDWRRAE